MTDVIERFEAMARSRPGARIRLERDRVPEGSIDADELVEAIKRLPLHDLPRALEASAALERVDPEDGWRRARLVAARAHVLCYANRFEDAMESLVRARALAAGAPAADEVGWIDLASVQPLARLGRLAEAEDAALTAGDAFARAGNDLGRGKSLLNLGIVRRMRGRPGESIEAFDGALSLVRGDAFLSAAIASNRAEAMQDLDRFDEAEKSFEAALADFARSGHAHASSIVEGNIADLLSRQGRLDAALERYDRVRARFEGAGARADVARLEAEQSEVLAAIGAGEAALRSYSRSIPSLEAAGLAQESARARLGLGLVLLRLGHEREAEATLRGARDSLASLGHGVLRAQCEIALAGIAIRGGERADADDALAALESRPARRAHAIAELADAHLDAGRPEGARAHLARLEAAAEAERLGPLRARVRHIRGRWLRAQGRSSEAVEALSEGVREADALRNSLRAEQWRVAFSHARSGIYHDAFSTGLDAGTARGLSLAFDAIERLRARSLLDAIGAEHAPAAYRDDADSRRLEALTREMNVLYSAFSPGSVRRAGDESALDAGRLAALEREAADLRARLAGSSTFAHAEPYSLEEARARLGERALVVLFVEESESVSAIALSRAEATVHRAIAGRRDVREAASRAAFALGGLLRGGLARAPMWEASLARLGERLLGPLRRRIDEAEDVSICPSGGLARVAWGLVGLGDGRRLLDRARVTIVPSVSAGVRLRDTPGRGRRVLAVGVSDEVGPRMEAEARAVGAGAPGATVLTGGSATADRVLDALGRADVVHLATHGVFSEWHPMSSRLRLADRWVTAREIAGSILPGCSIVLAGCESGASGGENSEDRQGLVHALLAAGAREVVASLWALHDRTASGVVARMFECAAQDDRINLAGALRRAQLEASKQGVAEWWWGSLITTGGVG